MDITSERLQKLSTKQQAVYELLLKKRQAETAARKQIVRLSREVDSFPLSFAQQRLWLINELHPGGPTYNIPLPVRLQGRLDVRALRRSLDEVVRRHESLRTSFALRGEELRQFVTPHAGFRLPLVDLTALSEGARAAAADALVAEDYGRPFDLGRAPLLRAVLLTLGPEENVLTLTMHHIISDDWSIGLLAREVVTLYEAFSAGRPSPLPPLEIQYVDFAHWQRQGMRGDALEKHLAYWDKQLGGDLPRLELLADRPRGAAPTFGGATHPVSLSRDVTESLRAVGEGEGATLFMTLLAAFQVMLQRYTGQDEIVVGSPVANRNRVETEGVIGFFVNMLVLRTDLSGNPSFRALLRRVREVTLGAYAHQDLPFEQVVERVQPERSLSHTPLFQVALVLQNASGALRAADGPAGREESREGGLRWSPYGVSRGTAKFDLTLNLHETPDGIRGVLEYSTDLFDAPAVERMAGHFQNLLRAVAADESLPIWSLPMLGEDERRGLLGQGATENDGARAGRCIHHLFEEQAAARPDAVAVVFEEERLTYAQLNGRANQLAHHLRGLGLSHETLVGICLEPSPELVVAILAVLKAGGGYLPLDPAYPAERLGFILADARVRLVLTRQNLSGSLPESDARLVCLDSEGDVIARASTENPDGGAGAESLAYVIYTSGSTGRPKGVEVVHRNLTSLLAATEGRFGFRPSDVWTLFHSSAFDFSVWELWGALLYGGRLVVVPYWIARTPEAMYELAGREGVTVLNQTPSAFKQFIEADEASPEERRVKGLRFVIFGGEALDFQSLKGWAARHGDERPQLINMYGITETTVHVTYRRVRAEDVRSGVGSVIGGPIDGWELYLLDRGMNPVPQGVKGELYVGGAGVARGYLKRPELTAERFVADEYGGRAGRRLYRTGDLGRRRADGEIEYLGRIDQQVKIRGFRIELGEIEAALSLHPNVEQAVVLAREDGAGGKRLAAYVVARDASGGLENLRAYLSGKLPSYMIPSAFVPVEAMPLTAHGKLDKRALLSAEPAGPEPEELYAPPRTPLEEVLAGVWGEVLGVERVGIYDNFFALGGDSIRSIQVRARAAERGVQFSVQQLFQLQNIHELARAAGFARAPAGRVPLEPFGLLSEGDRSKLPEGLEDAYPLAALQAGMLFHSEYSREALLYQNVSSFRLRAPFSEGSMRAATERLMSRHGVLRTSFDLNSFSEPLQLVHEALPPPLQVKDVRGLTAEEKDALIDEFIAAERSRHFEWGSAPLLRLCIHVLTDDTFQFTLTEHHAILDGWSVASLLTELFRVYFSLVGGSAPAPEPPPTLTFGEYVALEREALTSDECRRFWGERLSGSTAITLPRPASVEHGAAPRIRTVNVQIPEEVSDGLKRLALKTAVPLKSVLLAAHLRVLSMYGGRADVTTGLVSNGRPEEADGERVLGLFLNTLPFRLKLDGGTWEELARQTFDAERELLPYKRYPMAELQKERAGQQLFEAAFNFTHFHVYESVGETGDVEVLRAVSLAATNFTLGTNFSLGLGEGARVELTLHCNVAEIGDDLADALADSYGLVLDRIAREPRARYDADCLLPDAQRRKLLVEWNDTRRPAVGPCVHQLFEAQAARAPEAAAVVSEFGDLSYGELNRRADALASRLRLLGVGPEVCVGICVEPSPEMFVGLLGILKAGGAYVPLDPSETPERLASVVVGAGVSTVLTRQSRAEVFADYGVRQIWVDDEEGDGPQAGACVTAEVCADNLACVIHTSGSTGGAPKAVMLSHGALANHARSMIETYALDASHRVSQFFATHFTAAEEIFPVLASGAAVLLPPRGARASASNLIDYYGRAGVTTLQLPAAYWHQLEDELERAGREVPESVRLFVVGGDSPSIEKVSRRVGPGRAASRFFNSYGQVETTHTCAAYEVTPALTAERSNLPIGKPFVNTRSYVLDSFLQPVPIGVVGELHIGGAGLARGYSRRPGLTAEKFIPDPFADEPGRRLFKTGDFARHLPDGDVEFLGRADRELDIRGFRVGLAEIEEKLQQHAGVRKAFVIAKGDGPCADGGLDESAAARVATTAETPGDLRPRRDEVEDAPATFEPPDAEERRRIVEDWNRTRRDFPRPRATVAQLFETQAAANPAAIALSLGTNQMTYADLDERSNQLARYLLRRGLRPEQLVGLLLAHPVRMVVSILAVLKAGAAYLPLDPSYPPERLAYMLDDSGARLLLTQEALAEQAARHAGGRQLLCLDAESEAIGDQSSAAVEGGAGSRNLAYVIYTSGSTGRPKGVMIEHGSLRNLALAQVEAFRLDGGSRVLQLAPWGFDASVSELFTALLAGATLCLVPAERRLPGEEFVRLLREERVTIATIVPSMLAAVPEAELPELEALVVAGEECPPVLARRWVRGRRLYNAYGPTEVTVCASMKECVEVEGKVPIGRPLANGRVYVLDERQEPVGVGATGELYVGGEGVGRGYLGRPGLTAERFIPDGMTGEGGGRLYRTGDKVRWNREGELEYVGRADDQVKVRGFRVEPGEVEALLREHEQIRQAAVVVREDDAEDRRLVAYIVPGPVAPAAAELRRYLSGSLPDYMVPSAFILLESLPQTSSGKLDRKALPKPEQARPELSMPFLPPSTRTEEVIAGVWAEVLRLDKVGIDDNFFDLGGHSLLTVKAHERIRAALSIDIPLLKLFQHPTVRTLAAFLAGEQEAQVATAEQERDWAARRRQSLKNQRRMRS